VDQPLLAAAARKLAKEIIETGSVGFTKHAEEEMAKDKLASVDVIKTCCVVASTPRLSGRTLDGAIRCSLSGSLW
jgi:hypothetical protein